MSGFINSGYLLTVDWPCSLIPMLSYEANADGITADRVIDEIVKNVAVA